MNRLIMLANIIFLCLLMSFEVMGQSSSVTTQEPSYDGKPLSYWIHELKTNEGCWSNVQSALPKIGLPAVLGLIEVLNDKNSKQRECAALILSKIGSTEAVPSLTEALMDSIKDSSFGLFRWSITALGNVGRAERKASLTDSKNGRQRMEALEPVVSVLIDVMKKAAGNERLGMTASEIFRDAKFQVALSQFGPIAVRSLVKVIGNKEETPLVRAICIEAIGLIGNEAMDALPLLKLLINDGNESALVQYKANIVVRNIEIAQTSPVQNGPARVYKQGETYTLGDVIKLNEGDRVQEGNSLTVELVRSGQATGSKGTVVELKLKIFGDAQNLVYELGEPEVASFVLVAEQKRIPPSDVSFTDEVISKFSSSTVVSRFQMRTKDGGMAFFRDTTHPLVLRFEIPIESSQATKKLEIKKMTLGTQKYSLVVNLNK